eukprot:1142707-Pelagomonas_calceolata.AAC.11
MPVGAHLPVGSKQTHLPSIWYFFRQKVQLLDRRITNQTALALPTPLAGLFLAPQTTGEALKGGRLVAEVMHREGYNVMPAPGWFQPHFFFRAVSLFVQSRTAVGAKWVAIESPGLCTMEPLSSQLLQSG